MDRTGTSHTRAGSSNGKLRKLGPGSRSRPYDPARTLSDPAFVQKAILQALREGDLEAVLDVYRAHLRVLNRSRAAQTLHVSRQAVHKMLRSSSAPSLRTFAAFMRLLTLEAAAK